MAQKDLGKLFIVAPVLTFILVLVIWFVGHLFLDSGSLATARAFNVGIGFFGFLSFILIPIGVVVGLVMMATGPREEKK